MTSNRKGHCGGVGHTVFILSYKDLSLLKSLLSLYVLTLYDTLLYQVIQRMGSLSKVRHGNLLISQSPPNACSFVTFTSTGCSRILSVTLSAIIRILPDHNTVRILQLCLALAPCADRSPSLVPLDASRGLPSGFPNLQSIQRFLLCHTFNKSFHRG